MKKIKINQLNKVIKKFQIFLIILVFLIPLNIIRAENNNIGFVKSNIWYSKDPFEEGDKIQIYTLIFNSDSKELSGTISFFDDGILLGTKKFNIQPNKPETIYIDWVVTLGNHNIFAKIQNAQLLISKNTYQSISLNENETEKSFRTVSKKIIPNFNQINNQLNLKIDKTIDNIKTPTNAIAQQILENTPKTISQNIVSSIKLLESFRNQNKNNFKKNEEIIKTEIQNSINQEKDPGKGLVDTKKILTPFQYVKYFYYKVTTYIFNNYLIFYSVLIFTVYWILRLIWGKIFK